MSRSPKEVVCALAEAYNAKSLEGILDLYRPDARYWDPLHRDGVAGREAIGGLMRELFAAFPDERMETETLASDETHAVAEFRSTGTSSSGQRFELELTEVYEIVEERIAWCRAYFDPKQLPT